MRGTLSLDALLLSGLYRKTREGRENKKGCTEEPNQLGRVGRRACGEGKEYEVQHESSRAAAAWDEGCGEG